MQKRIQTNRSKHRPMTTNTTTKTYSILTAVIICLVCHLNGFSYNIKRVTTKQGLSNSAVLTIEQASNKVMLLGTCDGVNCWNGASMNTLTNNQNTFLPDNIIERIIVDKQGCCWVLTNHQLTRVMKDEPIRNYPQFYRAKGIHKNEDGQLILLQDNTLYYAMPGDSTLHTLTLKDDDHHVKDFSMTSRYVFLFCDNGIVRYSLNKGSKEYTLGTREINMDHHVWMAANDEGIVYFVNDEKQLWDYNLTTCKSQHLTDLKAEIMEYGQITAIKRFKDDIFVGFLADGMLRLHDKDYSSKTFIPEVQTGVSSFYRDEENDILWIGTDGMGALTYCDEPDTYRSLTNDQMRLWKNKAVRAILMDEDNCLWVGTKGDGLLELPNFDINRPVPKEHYLWTMDKGGLAGNTILALSKSKKLNGFWIATDKGLNFRISGSNDIKTVKTEVPINWISALLERGDTLWMATQGMGVYRGIIKGGGSDIRLESIRNFTLNNEMQDNYFFSVSNNTEGPIYFGNRGKGLYKMQNDRLQPVKLNVQSSNTMGFSDIFSILQTSEGLWIGTGHGLILQGYDGHTECFDTSNDMPNNVIHALCTDQEGNVWASTNKGLVKVMRETHEIRIFNENSNLTVNEYCDGAVFSSGNTVYFGGFNGFSVIKHDATKLYKEHNMQLEFFGLCIYDTPVNIDDYMKVNDYEYTLTLPYDKNTFQLHTTTYDYLTTNNYRYYYAFEKNGQWVDNGSSSTFAFTQMSVGEHVIYIKFVNTLTGQKSGVYQCRIIITPPWYGSWWARLLYLLMAVAVGYAIYRRRSHNRAVKMQMLQERQKQEQRDKVYEEKMNFLTNLVHELNTPLTLIAGPCEHILSRAGDDKFIGKYINMIKANINRLGYLIKEIIDFRRVSDGVEAIEIKRVAAGQWVDNMAKSFNNLAEDNHINFVTDIDQDVIWNTDERYLTRIVSNLISNAFKYSKSGATIRVTLKHDKEDNTLRLSVYNTGKGIAEKDRKRIFDYYTVLDNADESYVSGLTTRNGLGMAICHNAVTRLGGEITIDSVVNEYADFKVKLPWMELPENAGNDAPMVLSEEEEEIVTEIGESQEEEVAELAAETAMVTAAPHKPREPHVHRENVPTILIIDDNSDILELVEDALYDNYNVITSQSGEQGLELLKQIMPDLIVTDIMMPGINGLELTQQLKSNKHTMHIPLIILSAKRSDEEQVIGLQSGADAYLSKPFSIQYLQATVGRLLENRNKLKEYYNSSASAFTYQNGKLMTGEERDFRNQVIEVINKNLSNADFTPDDLAREMAISQRNLYRKFNEAGLPTPKEYIKNFKIEHAARQLSTTNLPIQEIIYSSGFNTRSQFYTEFRKHFGITPKEYREEKRVRDDSLEN